MEILKRRGIGLPEGMHFLGCEDPLTGTPRPRFSSETPRLWLRPAVGGLALEVWNLLPETDPQRRTTALPGSAKPKLVLTEIHHHTVLLDKVSGAFVGFIGTADSRHRPGWLEVTYAIAADRRGHGFASEALRRLARAIQTWTTTPGLLAIIPKGHEASLRVVRAAGFQPDPQIDPGPDECAWSLSLADALGRG